MYLYVRSDCSMLVNPFNKVANYSLLSILRLVKITHQESSQTSMLMLHPIHNRSECIPIWFDEMLKMRNRRMLCLFQPLVGKRYGFCQARCRIESLEYLISIVDMCHKCIEQLLLCFKKLICTEIYAVI